MGRDKEIAIGVNLTKKSYLPISNILKEITSSACQKLHFVTGDLLEPVLKS